MLYDKSWYLLDVGDTASPPCKCTCSSIHQFAEALGCAIDAKDHHTRCHSEQVAALAYALALDHGVSREAASAIHIAGHLHDLGKIAVPDHILLKEGPLSPEEWEVMKRHPEVGAHIVAPVKALNDEQGIAAMILHHHERFDGHGYPCGLAGDEIPCGARVLAVADCVSAMMQDRPYRRGVSLLEAAQEVHRQSGRQFDPDIALSFHNIVSVFKRQMPRRDDADFFRHLAHRHSCRDERNGHAEEAA
ncbi:HD-GYP domain-containing protein [Megalodesulfovibrio gigas]|uniref:Putative metal dependent phosphohydrolase n=1 Tax=Megalodesulfovibrio gigas (strain ATCC 19364 / DSM 1382 / NCIMB 9332 / VKM B-1759) TaxID=1121448 RepID=T2G8N0_MEGG1|nr:HD domain-containing phosphohydrolase [Megalodesulfovibrio gigas]AGW12534.1 putative metal dependent phosphohydrolase [Megalodesulfovibrio gigas DSM 1382 = ATCC 19364]